MKVIILAAGYSTRLYPLTLNTPKPLLEVGGHTMLDRILLALKKVPGAGTVYVATNERFNENFQSWHRNLSPDIYEKQKIVLVNDGTTSNENRLGPVGDIMLAVERHQIDDDLLVLAGDNLFELDLFSIAGLRMKHDATVLGVYDFKNPELVREKFGVVLADEEGRVLDFEEKPKAPKSAIAATAIYLIRQADLPIIKDLYAHTKKREMNAGDIIVGLLAHGAKVYSQKLDVWFDIGSHEDLARAQEYFK